MSVLQKIVDKIDELLPLAEAFAKTTPSKTDDFALGLLRMALDLFKHRVQKATESK